MIIFDSNNNQQQNKHKDGPNWNIIERFSIYSLALNFKEEWLKDFKNKNFDIKIKKQTMSGKEHFVLKIRKNLSILLKEQKDLEQTKRTNKKTNKEAKISSKNSNKNDILKHSDQK